MCIDCNPPPAPSTPPPPFPPLPPPQVTFKGDGPLAGIQVIADATGMVKGKVGNPAADPPLRPDGKLNVGRAEGRGEAWWEGGRGGGGVEGGVGGSRGQGCFRFSMVSVHHKPACPAQPAPARPCSALLRFVRPPASLTPLLHTRPQASWQWCAAYPSPPAATRRPTPAWCPLPRVRCGRGRGGECWWMGGQGEEWG